MELLERNASGELCLDGVSLSTLVNRFGTPCYVYSRRAIEAAYLSYTQALGNLPARICYAVKANSNLAVLNVLARLSAGFDIVSRGELERVLAAGGRADRILFSGVGKTRDDMLRALEVGVFCFNVESAEELERLNQVALQADRIAPISLRVNPDVDPQTHPYISTGLRENKFGVSMDSALALYQHAATLPGLRITGMDCHIGSQITQLTPFLDALDRLLALVDALAVSGVRIHHLDMGGGLGVRYNAETPPDIAELVQALQRRLHGRDLELILEPGRSIIANAGVLLTRVEYVKPTPHKRFAIVDAGMNDLIRPALYDAWMDVVPVRAPQNEAHLCDIVGPVCESGDFLAKDRQLDVVEGDLLAVCSAGAYGFVMSSNYNTRPRATEVMLDQGNCHLISEREKLTDLYAGERLLPE